MNEQELRSEIEKQIRHELAVKGGKALKEKRGRDHFVKIGKKGAKVKKKRSSKPHPII